MSAYVVARATLAVRLGVVSVAFIYVALLHAIYVGHISPAFAYLGYVLTPAPVGMLVLAFVAAWLPSLWLPVRLLQPSTLVYWLLYVLAYVPSTFMPGLTLDREPVDLLMLLATLVGSFALLGLILRVPRVPFSRPRLDARVYWAAVFVLTGTLLAVVVMAFGFPQSIPSLADVYDVRADYREADAGRLQRFAVSWLGNVLLPIFIAVGLLRRAPAWIVVGVAGQLFLYAATGFKSILFSSALVLCIFVALSLRGRLFGLAVAFGAMVLAVGTWAIDQMLLQPLLSSWFVRRLILTPGILTGWYFDYFHGAPKAQLAHSVLSPFLDYPYPATPPILIGDAYFGQAATYANANLWADAFANFGFVGMISFTLLLGAFLWTYDGLASGDDFPRRAFATILLGGPAISLANSALLTSMLTHGVALAWLAVFFMPRATLQERSRRPHAPPPPGDPREPRDRALRQQP